MKLSQCLGLLCSEAASLLCGAVLNAEGDECDALWET